MIELLNIDCLEYMATQPDKYFDLAIVDPPYGKNIDNNKKNNFVMTKHKSKLFDTNIPPPIYFRELFRISKYQIIWGGNYMNLAPSKTWIIWNKLNPLKGKFSDFEMAWTNYKNKPLMMYDQAWIGFGRHFLEKSDSIHPTQKPISLYRWILINYAKPAQKILDTHLGSGSSAIAAHYFGCDFVGCEIDKEYYDAMIKRFKRETAQLTMFEGI